MSNDVAGQGPLNLPKGFPMDPSVMSGMQPAGDDKLHLEVNLQNITSTVQSYDLNDFRPIAPCGQTRPIIDDGGKATVNQALIQPNYSVDVYFDVPVEQSKDLSIEWSRDGKWISRSVLPTSRHLRGSVHVNS